MDISVAIKWFLFLLLGCIIAIIIFLFFKQSLTLDDISLQTVQARINGDWQQYRGLVSKEALTARINEGTCELQRYSVENDQVAYMNEGRPTHANVTVESNPLPEYLHGTFPYIEQQSNIKILHISCRLASDLKIGFSECVLLSPSGPKIVLPLFRQTSNAVPPNLNQIFPRRW